VGGGEAATVHLCKPRRAPPSDGTEFAFESLQTFSAFLDDHDHLRWLIHSASQQDALLSLALS
jgi:hypothetical protein